MAQATWITTQMGDPVLLSCRRTFRVQQQSPDVVRAQMRQPQLSRAGVTGSDIHNLAVKVSPEAGWRRVLGLRPWAMLVLRHERPFFNPRWNKVAGGRFCCYR